ncbi:MAG: hypothetical protein ACLT8W_02385, partial [Bacteroides caccae]
TICQRTLDSYFLHNLEGGVAESRGGRWIHNADNNRLTHSPTTSPYGDSSFPKEENEEYYRLSNYYFPN